jgi:hypothetical protein
MMSLFQSIAGFCSLIFKSVLIVLVRFYQLAISPLMANHCRFEPTCSRYAITAIERHGVFKGSWLAVRRIGRCRPGVVGGWDPVPEQCTCGREHHQP